MADAAIEAGEEKSPNSAIIDGSDTNFCAIGTDCFGSDCESSQTSLTFFPSTPPLLLISESAISKPCFQYSPYSAEVPVSGAETPKLIVSLSAVPVSPVSAEQAVVESKVVANSAVIFMYFDILCMIPRCSLWIIR